MIGGATETCKHSKYAISKAQCSSRLVLDVKVVREARSKAASLVELDAHLQATASGIFVEPMRVHDIICTVHETS
jgi:hypothetical protein